MMSATLLTDVLSCVAANTALPDDRLAAFLRERVGAIHVTVCRDDDVPGRISPVAENAVSRLYYVSSGNHCLRLTRDEGEASGLLVGRIDQDE